MKIAIVSERRSYLFQLAIELMKHDDMEVTVYTILPAVRCRNMGYKGPLVTAFFPLILAVLIEKIPFINPYKRSNLRIRLRIFYDWYVSRRLKRCDVLIGGNGSTVKASVRAREKYGAITICDQGSSHILQQNAVRLSYSDVVPPQINTNYMLRHYNTVDYIMSPSTYVKKSNLDNGITANRILYNPFGVDLNVFRPTQKPGQDSYDVIMVGSWWKHKGCDMLAEACINKLGVSLLHVGSVIDCKLPDSPLFSHIDFVPEYELPKYYAQAKVFSMPSLDEGLGLVQLQAAACGLPVVGSTRSGVLDLSQLLGNPKECITVEEPLNVDNIAAAITAALKIAAAMPEGPRDQYQSKIHELSWEAYGERYYEILKTIIG